MARENQGLQVALIIFVMLFVVSLASTVYFFNVSQDAEKRAAEFQAAANKSETAHRDKIAECNELKRIIGVASTENLEAVQTASTQDFKDYGGALPEEDRNYREALENMFSLKNEKEGDLAAAREENVDLANKLEERTSREEVAFKELETLVGKHNSRLGEVTKDYEDDKQRVKQEQDKVQDLLKEAQDKSTNAIKEVQSKLAGTNAQLMTLSKLNEAYSKRIEDIDTDTFEVPDGEIQWVNQQTRTVWINLGREHHLMRQVTFSVYPSDVSDLSQGGKKASIEVIRVVGGRSAEARIVEDKITDPIMPGDKIHTPAWSPGEQKRFALAGLLDVDGDGDSDLDTVRHIITMNGGAVDCYYDEQGEQVGEITIDTKFLVLGEAPNERGAPKVTAAYSQMVQEAGRWSSVKEISLDDLLNRMGYKKAATGDSGTRPKTSSGSRGQFKPRRPPARAGGAY